MNGQVIQGRTIVVDQTLPKDIYQPLYSKINELEKNKKEEFPVSKEKKKIISNSILSFKTI